MPKTCKSRHNRQYSSNMKKIVFALMALAMLSVSVSCKKEEPQEPEPPSRPDPSYKAAVQIVALDNQVNYVA